MLHYGGIYIDLDNVGERVQSLSRVQSVPVANPSPPRAAKRTSPRCSTTRCG
jgi:hypothetical protein